MISISNILTSKNNSMLKKQTIGQSPSLNQGKKFKKYQNKITNSLETNSVFLTGKEGFTGFSGLNGNGLTARTNKIIDNNNYSSQQQNIENLRQEYQNTLKEYQDLAAKISGNTNAYINRVNPNNPYLNKCIRFTTGHVCYVTNQGVLKYIPSPDIWNSLDIPKTYTDINLPYLDTYQTPGTLIPTDPPLLSGTNVQMGQSFGNEGANVFVNELIKNPTTSYVGCYNNNPPVTELIFVPVMNASNNVNGFISRASSIYQNNNQFAGPWAAFDKNPNDFWHSEVSGSTDYDASTGEYTGVNGWDCKDTDGTMIHVKGEWVWIECPPGEVLTKYDIQGRQGCCGNPSGRSPNSWVIIGGVYNEAYEIIDKKVNEGLNFELKTYTVNNSKKYNHFIFLTTNCGNPGDRTGNRYCVQIAQWNLYTTSNYTSSSQSAMNSIGIMNFEQCKTTALNTGNKYFSLDNPDADGNGTCMIANELSQTQQNGPGDIYNPIPLWDTKTNSNGITALLDKSGSLQVMNATGQPVFLTPVPDEVKSDPNPYIGCFKHKSVGKYQQGGLWKYTDQECMDLVTQQGYKYVGYGGGPVRDTNHVKRCLGFNDLESARMNGSSKECKKPYGAVGSAAIYATDNLEDAGNCFLILQDDGNMCIYTGTGPNDNQGFIWQSETNGKQQQPNPNMAAAKSRYGRNYMVAGEQLLPNEFIGSTDGSMYLIMQTDGNLVLYTNTVSSGCKVNNNINIGDNGTNAVYQIDAYGQPQNIGKLAYIDGNASLHAYPDSNRIYGTDYTSINNANTVYNDIPGAAYGNANVDSCKQSCNSREDCSGFVFNRADSMCWPKNNQMFPYGKNFNVDNNVDIYVRNVLPNSPPLGVANNTNNIDSVKYNSYLNGGELNSKYGLADANSVEKQHLDQLQSRMNLLSSQINGLTNKFGLGSAMAEQQSYNNITGIDNYADNIKNTNKKIINVAGETSGNIQNILKDSDIVVLQKNYDYLFWSILAAGTVLVAMNIAK